MGLDAMASHVGEANTNVNTEAGLIAQIQTALEGKAASGSGGSGGGSVETCTVTIENCLSSLNGDTGLFVFVDGSLNTITEYLPVNAGLPLSGFFQTYTVTKGTFVYFRDGFSYCTEETATPIGATGDHAIVKGDCMFSIG